MSRELSFINIQWLWPILGIAILLWGVFIWKEWSQPVKSKRYINCGVALIAILSLVLLALKPVLLITDHTTKIVLLTPNYKPVQLDSLQQTYKGISVREYVDTKSILAPQEIPETLFVLGEGIRAFDLWQLDKVPTVYLGGNIPKGITRLKYPTRSVVGDSWIMKGQYQGAQQGHHLVLTDPGGKPLDSVRLKGEDRQHFELKVDLKLKGRFLYELLEKDSIGQIITKDPIPIKITDRTPLKIAIINEFPTFETKYVKNFLAEKGHEVLIRSQLTTARFKYEYFNMEGRQEFRFTKDALEDFDLLIIDVNSLRSLSRNRRKALEKAIRESGLGLFIQPDATVYTKTMPIASFDFLQKKQTNTTIKDWSKSSINTYPFVFKNTFSVTPMYGVDTNIVAAYERKGVGRVGTSVFQSTYELLLNGQTQTYQGIWTKIVQNLSKKQPPNVLWKTPMTIAYPDEPFDFQLRTQFSNLTVIDDTGLSIPLKGHKDIASLWEGVTYPKDIGWETLRLEQDTMTILDYYVTDTQKWMSIKATQTAITNERYFQDRKWGKNQDKKIPEPINPLWFFLLFLGTIGWLWFAPKL